jgi:hypothetical protein
MNNITKAYPLNQLEQTSNLETILRHFRFVTLTLLKEPDLY